MEAKEITIIGSGNVATNLASEIRKKVTDKIHINGRTESNVKQLAEKVQASYSVSIEDIPSGSQLYILSVSDDSLQELTENPILKEKIDNNIVVHTAGSIPMEVLKNLSGNYGVFYPLQTFSKFNTIDFKNVPICLEASSGFNYDRLSKYAFQISEKVRKVNSEQRKIVHLAAVFANNFSNRMFSIAEELLKNANIDFELLLPLLDETIEKVKKSSPSKVQTGPAVRNDIKVIDKHLKLLEKHKELQELYVLISQNIKDNS